MDPSKIWAEIWSTQLWIVLGAAAALGVIGAMLHARPTGEPDATGERPRRTWRDIAAGGVAAIAIIYLANPTSATALVAGSLVAGYAANIVLAGLEARSKAATAATKAAENARVAAEAQRRADANADVARRATYALDELVRASDHGIDVKPIVHELRAKRVLSLDPI